MRARQLAAVLGTFIVSLAMAPAGFGAPPPNDDFEDASALSGNVGAVEGSTVEATREPGEPNHGAGAGDASVWYRWVAPETRRYEVDTCGSALLTKVGVYTGSALASLTTVAGDGSDHCGNQSYVAFEAVAGTTYHFAVEGAGLPSIEGAFTLNWGTAAPARNDAFETARVLQGPSSFLDQSNRAATEQASEPDHAGNTGGASVWFVWTASSSRLVSFEVQTAYDSLLAVYTGSTVGGLTPVVASDDWDGGPGSRVTFDAVAGTTYRIAVDGFDGDTGDFRLWWSGITRPGNDDFANASTHFRGTNLGATREAGEPAHGGLPGGASIWFKWEAPLSGWAIFSTCETTFDTVLGVYTGATITDLATVASDDDACGQASSVRFRATSGTTYYIAVDVARGEGGFVEMSHSMGPMNDDFADAEQLSGPFGVVSGSTSFATHELDEPFHAAEPGTGSVWYRWTAPAAARVVIDTCNSASDTLLGVYLGQSVAALSQVAANDDSCGSQSSVQFDTAPATTYSIAVDGFDDWVGFSLRWSTAPLIPRNLEPPTISGNPAENDVLTASTGTWEHATSYSYSWFSCTPGAPPTPSTCKPIVQPSSPQLVVPTSAFGRQIRVNVYATGPHGSQGVYSALTTPVGYGRPFNEEPPILDGFAEVGQTLAASEGRWRVGSAPRTGLTYTWQRCNAVGAGCVSVKGPGSEATYPITAADRGATVRVVVGLSTAGGTASAASASTEVILAPGRVVRRRMCVVPRLVGKSLRAARTALTRSRCRLGKVRRAYSSRKAGLVVKQNIRAGRRLRAGARVSVVLSRGRRR